MKKYKSRFKNIAFLNILVGDVHIMQNVLGVFTFMQA